MKRWMIGAICFALLAFGGVALAQDSVHPTPLQTADAIRDALFAAQSALLHHDDAAAKAAADQAEQIYMDSRFAGSLADVDAALTAARSGDALALATARGEVWTALLKLSAEQVFTALAAGDTAAATLWLPLRDYRPSTRFSRPSADATLAVSRLADGTISPDEALAAARADLFDTYQAQLNGALADADEADGKAFGLRRAEETGLAAGYYRLLADVYQQQRGDEAADQLYGAFAALVSAGVSDDSSAYASARGQIDTLLSGFRAAPLSETEAARRAGQLVRFLSLVPVEYERGVSNGQVIKDLEIQEALTFRDGAAAAFADLESLLTVEDGAATDQVAALLTTLQTQIHATADPADVKATVDQATNTLTAAMPAAWQSVNTDSDVDVIFSLLEAVEAAVEQKQYPLAESSRLEAYSLMEMGMEQRLRGFAPDVALKVESLFWEGTADRAGLSTLIGSQAPASEIKATLADLRSGLLEGQTILSSANSAPAAIAGNAAIIVFREGLEAVLILASLLASLRKAEERQFRRPLVIGALLALIASAITWWGANQILTVLLPLGERLEAIVSLIAIGVLLLITNWFFHKVYWVGWMAGFHSRKRRLVGGIAVVTISQALGLVILGFTSIYREGFETVLFLQSLVLDAGMSVVLQGVALGLIGTAVVGVITFALQVRLPYKKMLVVTGIFIGLVLVTMVGNTVHVMQTLGWLPITPIAGLQLPYWFGQWLGIFATWQGIGLQVAAAAFVIGSYFLAEYQTKHQRETRVNQPEIAGKPVA